MLPPKFFISVSHNFNKQKFVIKKNLSKMPVLSFSFDWDQYKSRTTVLIFYSVFSCLCPSRTICAQRIRIFIILGSKPFLSYLLQKSTLTQVLNPLLKHYFFGMPCCLSCQEILITQVIKKIPAKYYSSIKTKEY